MSSTEMARGLMGGISALPHAMPFGAEVQTDGRVRFRLWAPACERVLLRVEGRTEGLLLKALADGWHELVTAKRALARVIALRCRTGCACPIQPPATNRRTCTGQAK